MGRSPFGNSLTRRELSETTLTLVCHHIKSPNMYVYQSATLVFLYLNRNIFSGHGLRCPFTGPVIVDSYHHWHHHYDHHHFTSSPPSSPQVTGSGLRSLDRSTFCPSLALASIISVNLSHNCLSSLPPLNCLSSLER